MEQYFLLQQTLGHGAFAHTDEFARAPKNGNAGQPAQRHSHNDNHSDIDNLVESRIVVETEVVENSLHTPHEHSGETVGRNNFT